MGKEFNRRKPGQQKQLPAGNNSTNTEVMEKKENKQDPESDKMVDPNEKTVYQQHKDFIKGGANDTPADGETTTPLASHKGPPVDMTPELEKPALEESVFNTPTVENDYISQNRGLNSKTPPPNSNGAGNNSETFNPTTPPPNTSSTSSDTWQPTEPPPVSAPDSAPEAEQGPPPNGMGTDSQPFTIPAGTAEETIQWGFEMLNYGLRNLFGGFLVDVKVGKQHLVKLPASAIDPMTALIKDKNTKNRERLTFDQEEINMIKRPLAKIMAEKGIRGLTPTEELAMVAIIVIGKKGKEISEIRGENKVLETKIAQLIAEEYAKNKKHKKETDDAEDATVLED